MKALLITLAVGLFAVTTAHARLGWTLEKCREFYGPDKEATAPGGTVGHTFHKDGVDIDIVIIFDSSGKASLISYYFSLEPTLHEIHDLLDKNSLGATWDYTPRRSGDGYQKWTEWLAYRQGGLMLIAQHHKAPYNSLTISLQSEAQREREQNSNPNL
jgi:hypothetical protein